jgi:hypothetical protein
MKQLLLSALLLTPFLSFAQGVTIGANRAPDASATLDIVSTSKGVLLPRVADATALATPATGLLVFQTEGTPGFYYNAGTPALPSWQRLAGVGSAKPASQTYGAADFQPEAATYFASNGTVTATTANNKVVYDANNVDNFYTVGNGGALRAPLRLPQGATITGLTVRYYDTVIPNLSVALHRGISTGGVTTLLTATSAGIPAAGSVTVAPSSALVIDNDNIYYLRATFPTSTPNLTLVSVSVSYTVVQAE